MTFEWSRTRHFRLGPCAEPDSIRPFPVVLFLVGEDETLPLKKELATHSQNEKKCNFPYPRCTLSIPSRTTKEPNALVTKTKLRTNEEQRPQPSSGQQPRAISVPRRSLPPPAIGTTLLCFDIPTGRVTTTCPPPICALDHKPNLLGKSHRKSTQPARILDRLLQPEIIHIESHKYDGSPEHQPHKKPHPPHHPPDHQPANIIENHQRDHQEARKHETRHEIWHGGEAECGREELGEWTEYVRFDDGFAKGGELGCDMRVGAGAEIGVCGVGEDGLERLW